MTKPKAFIYYCDALSYIADESQTYKCPIGFKKALTYSRGDFIIRTHPETGEKVYYKVIDRTRNFIDNTFNISAHKI